MLVTLLRSNLTSSQSVRLSAWMMLPSIGVHQPVRVDDQAAVVRDRELARPDLAGRAVDLDLGDDRNDGAVAPA